MRGGKLTFLIPFIFGYSWCPAQSTDSLSANIKNIPDNFYAKIDKKYSSIENNLSKKSIHYLQKLRRQENKLNKKISSFDSTSNGTMNKEVANKYDGFIKELSAKGKEINNTHLDQYSSYIDTLTTSLSFLKKYSDVTGKVKFPVASLDQLKSKFNQSEKIKQFIAERKKQLQEALAKYTKLPASLKREYEQLNKTAYYYSAQVKEYKEMLNDPKKIEEKTIALLNKIPAFQKFFQQNSLLSSLFRMPDNYGSSQNLAGLQTRTSVQQVIQQRIAAGGPNAQAQVQQNLAQANAELNKLKDKINILGGGSGDIDIPDFKPNSQKTKPFLKRLEYGFNVQFGKNNALLPTTSDIALSMGYKLNDKSVAGIALNYNIGIGNIQHISFTSQGLGLRSFLDYKIKKQLYITGGYEMNYNTAFKNIEQLKSYNAWQRIALIGISKKYSISKKVKGNMQLLYDFLAHSHVPVSPQLIYRVGYNF